MARDHLFISYAIEDLALAEWLTLRLTAEGYRVWCDRIELLGGESYPLEIDRALRERSFRAIALLSRHSATKANPLKERTLALNLGRERGEDFLLVVNVDGLKPADLPWELQDLTYIPFYKGWGPGLAQLLRQLERLKAPHLASAMPTSISHYLNQRAWPEQRTERLWSNVLELGGLPDSLMRIHLGQPLSQFLLATWPHYQDGRVVWALEGPPEADVDIVDVERVSLVDVDETSRGPKPKDVLTVLVKEHLRVRCIERRLRLSPNADYFYFPPDAVPANRINFIGPEGGKSWLAPVGERGVRSANGNVERFRHHLAVAFRPEFQRYGPPIVQVRVRVHLTDLYGRQLPTRKQVARRKRVTRDWWNHQWLMRQFAAMSWIADGADSIPLTRSVVPSMTLKTRGVALSVDVGIDETTLAPAVTSDDTELIDETDLMAHPLGAEVVDG